MALLTVVYVIDPLCVFVPGVFSQCHKNDEERARKLLVRVSPFWGKTTCLRLALEADDKNFVAQSGVQVEQTFILGLFLTSFHNSGLESCNVEMCKTEKFTRK